jgi:hypothetical protein
VKGSKQRTDYRPTSMGAKIRNGGRGFQIKSNNNKNYKSILGDIFVVLNQYIKVYFCRKNEFF